MDKDGVFWQPVILIYYYLKKKGNKETELMYIQNRYTRVTISVYFEPCKVAWKFKISEDILYFIRVFV
jgi:hypothetical protein